MTVGKGTLVLPVVTNGTSVLPVVANGTSVLPVVANGTLVLPVVANGTSVLLVVANGTLVLPVVANGTSVLPVVGTCVHCALVNGTCGVVSALANETSDLRSVENRTSLIEGDIYGSEVERVLSLLFVGLSTAFSLCAQLLVLATIIKSPKLHNAHFYLLGVYCCVDITLVSLAGPAMITLFSSGNIPLSTCQVLAGVTTICVQGMIGHNAVVAYERYTYFCHPFHYERRFSTALIVITLGMCYAIPVTLVATREALFSTSAFHASNLSCNISNAGIHRFTLLVVIVLPSIAVTVYCMIRVWKLSRRAEVSPEVQGNLEIQSTPVQQARKTLKMILLLSGTFWATTLPAIVGGIIILSADYTWEDLDIRRYLVPSIILRLAVFTHCFISSAVNPVIYLYSRKDLRLAMRKLLQRNNNTVQPEIYCMN